MTKILIIHSHWNNRGDEAALRALIDELLKKYNDLTVKIQILANHEVLQFPYQGDRVKKLQYRFPRKRTFWDLEIALLTRGKISFTKGGREFCKAVKEADIIVHGPGGPNIGDVYAISEPFYLKRLLLVQKMHKPYVFYAPSMGPFQMQKRKKLREKILNGASLLCVREPISQKYLQQQLDIQIPIHVTLDSAFQNDCNYKGMEHILEKDHDLNAFLKKYDKVVGITVTDLLWHQKLSKDPNVKKNIDQTFKKFLTFLKEKKYGVVFIPQLFGEDHDAPYMSSLALDNCFTLSDEYDAYFQQFFICKLYAVVGMRYHSNIFSAKALIPFVSIAYEQKMEGFMKKADLSKYCLLLEKLNFKSLKEKFELLENEYASYREKLQIIKPVLKKEASETTKMLCEIIEEVKEKNEKCYK